MQIFERVKRRMKGLFKKAVAILAIFAMIFCIMAVAPTAASADIAIKLSATSCIQDGEITAQVYFPETYNKIAALDLTLSYDYKKLEVVSVTIDKEFRKAMDNQLNGEVLSKNDKIPGKINWVFAGGNNYELKGVFSTIVFKVRNYADHGACSLDLKVNRAANSGFVNMTDQVQCAGTTFTILRNSMNDMEFKLNSSRDGYIITEYNCGSYGDVIIADTYKDLPVVGIDSGVFENHAEIKSITFPSTLTYIGSECFAGCSGLTELVISENVERIDAKAFYQCDGLKSITLPVGLKTIGANAFAGCPFLTEIELPFTLTSLGNGAFNKCTLLQKVKISKNTAIGTNAFAACSDDMKFITVEQNTKLPAYISSSGIKASVEYVKDISLGSVNNISTQSFVKSAVTPTVTVTLTSGEKVTLNQDYKVVYRNNSKPGTAHAYVVGIGDYSEGYDKSFEIVCTYAESTKTVSKEATCTTAGSYTVICNACGRKTSEAIPAKGHTSDGNWVLEKRPTIYATGSKYSLCKVCKARAETKTIAKAYPDVNSDKKINSADALVVLRYSVDLWTNIKTEDQFMNADTNGDGKINSVDALAILRISVGFIQL